MSHALVVRCMELHGTVVAPAVPKGVACDVTDLAIPTRTQWYMYRGTCTSVILYMYAQVVVRSHARERDTGASPMLRYLDEARQCAATDSGLESVAERHDEILAETYLPSLPKRR